MATIALRRGYGLDINGLGPAPVKFLPSDADDVWNPGDLAVAGTYNIEQNNAPDTGIVGICETTNSGATAGDLIAVTLALPGFCYEFSYDGDSSSTDVRFVKTDFADYSAGQFAVVTTTSADDLFFVLDYAGDQGQFETHSFVAQAGTSETSGATNKPMASMGVDGDTDPRVIGYFCTVELAVG